MSVSGWCAFVALKGERNERTKKNKKYSLLSSLSNFIAYVMMFWTTRCLWRISNWKKTNISKPPGSSGVQVSLESSTGCVLCSVGHDAGKNSQHCHVALTLWQQWSDLRTDPSCVSRVRASEGQGSLRTDGWNYEVSSYLMDNRVRSSCDDVMGIILIYYHNYAKHMTAIHSIMLGFLMLRQVVHIQGCW